MAIFFSNFEFPLEQSQFGVVKETRDGSLRMCDPSYLCSKTFYMILLPLEDILRNEHWE